MDELMKMLEALFGHVSGQDQQGGEDHEDHDNEEENEKHPRVKKACTTILKDMRQEIHSLERTLAVLNAKREMLIEEHNALVDEVKAMEERSTSTVPIDETTVPKEEQPDGALPPESPREDKDHEDDHQGEEEQPASELKFDGMSRLERLRFGLDHALKVLDGSKMAFHFKAIKQLRLDLIDLANVGDKPEEERIAALEYGLKNAVEVLSTSPNAANSKTMRQLWSDLIVVLKPESDSQQ